MAEHHNQLPLEFTQQTAVSGWCRSSPFHLLDCIWPWQTPAYSFLSSEFRGFELITRRFCRLFSKYWFGKQQSSHYNGQIIIFKIISFFTTISHCVNLTKRKACEKRLSCFHALYIHICVVRSIELQANLQYTNCFNGV